MRTDFAEFSQRGMNLRVGGRESHNYIQLKKDLINCKSPANTFNAESSRRGRLKCCRGASEMVRLVKVLAVKAEDPNSSPRT